MAACKEGHLQVVKVLLATGTKPDMQTKVRSCLNSTNDRYSDSDCV